MKTGGLILIAVFFAGCIDFPPSGPPDELSQIVVSVHWQNQGVAGIPVVLVQTRDSVVTGTNGLAHFAVPAGHYVVRAFGINRGGPIVISTDYDVEAKSGEVSIVDVLDCLPCL